jgi:hypothetical protein
MPMSRQFSLGYALVEVALCAIALAAGRVVIAPAFAAAELQTLCLCVFATATFGALGGLCLRMALGLIAGSVLSVAAIPLVCLLMH